MTKADEKSLRDEIAALRDTVTALAAAQHCTCVHYHWSQPFQPYVWGPNYTSGISVTSAIPGTVMTNG